MYTWISRYCLLMGEIFDISEPTYGRWYSNLWSWLSDRRKYSDHRPVPKTIGWRWFKAIWNGFYISRERKEENPRNSYNLRARERKNTFYITLSQRQHLTFGTVVF